MYIQLLLVIAPLQVHRNLKELSYTDIWKQPDIQTRWLSADLKCHPSAVTSSAEPLSHPRLLA